MDTNIIGYFVDFLFSLAAYPLFIFAVVQAAIYEHNNDKLSYHRVYNNFTGTFISLAYMMFLYFFIYALIA